MVRSLADRTFQLRFSVRALQELRDEVVAELKNCHRSKFAVFLAATPCLWRLSWLCRPQPLGDSEATASVLNFLDEHLAARSFQEEVPLLAATVPLLAGAR